MNPYKKCSYLAAILLFCVILVSSCGKKEEASDAPATETTATDNENTEPTPTDTTQATDGGAGEGSTDNSSDTDTGSSDTDTADAEDASNNTNKTSSGLAERTVNEERLGIIIDLISQELEAQKLEYKSELGQDCSGIYHKIKDMVQRKMSVLGDDTRFHYPTYTADRNSRQIADWYYRNNNLHIVQDANRDRNLITPGTVVFFGRTEEKYSNINIDLLSNPGVFVHDGTKGKIMHIAVVTKVEKDDAGNVVKYDMMHGRNSRNFASRTTANYDGPGSYAGQHAKFPFGNWNQQLVALAHIETPK
ncbi:MAG: hypothetical protein AAF741_16725 [Bacteroidota bacterium]